MLAGLVGQSALAQTEPDDPGMEADETVTETETTVGGNSFSDPELLIETLDSAIKIPLT